MNPLDNQPEEPTQTKRPPLASHLSPPQTPEPPNSTSDESITSIPTETEETALAVTEQGKLAPYGTGGGHAWLAELERISIYVSKAMTVPDELRGKPGTILTVFLAGRELGIGPMEALRHVFVIKGQVTLSAQLKNKLLRRAGHSVAVEERTPTSLTLVGTRQGTGERHAVTWTVERAKQAGLIKSGGAWTTHTEAMLWARCISQLGREHFPEVEGSSFYSPEEMDPEALQVAE